MLILAPTREIAVQIKDVITSIGSQMDNLACHVFIGGLPVEDNKKMLKKPCHIAVGTPGQWEIFLTMYWMKCSHKYISLGHMAQKLKDLHIFKTATDKMLVRTEVTRWQGGGSFLWLKMKKIITLHQLTSTLKKI